MVEPLNPRQLAVQSGIAVAVLFVAGNAIWALGMPQGGASPEEIVDFYVDRSTRIVIGASLSLLSIAALVIFAADLRSALIERAPGDEALATAAFGGGLLAAAAGLGAESINMVGALRANDGAIDPGLASALYEISQILGSVAAGVGIGVLALSVALAGLRHHDFIGRQRAIALVLAVLALSPLAHFNALAGAVLVAVTVVTVVGLIRAPAT